jgi:hypothetical protein
MSKSNTDHTSLQVEMSFPPTEIDENYNKLNQSTITASGIDQFNENDDIEEQDDFGSFDDTMDDDDFGSFGGEEDEEDEEDEEEEEEEEEEQEEIDVSMKHIRK